MHKKLEADLISLAHSILKMKNKDDVFALKEKSKEVYDRLSMLAFVEEYVNVTPNLETTKEELLEKVEKAFEAKEHKTVEEETLENDNEMLKQVQHKEEKVVYNLIDEPKTVEKEAIKEEVKVEEVLEQPFDELEEIMFSKEETPKVIDTESNLSEKTEKIEPEIELNFQVNDVVKAEERKTMSLEEELQDIVSVDVMADLFENVQPKSINDKFASNIQIGLNDRIAFVKNLFNNQQEDYNRVISQLNTFKSENDAKNFIKKMVKPDYDWSEQEELETRFMEIIERKFA